VGTPCDSVVGVSIDVTPHTPLADRELTVPRVGCPLMRAASLHTPVLGVAPRGEPYTGSAAEAVVSAVFTGSHVAFEDGSATDTQPLSHQRRSRRRAPRWPRWRWASSVTR
jgi:hypothetical protein